jgi:hypothetical protein
MGFDFGPFLNPKKNKTFAWTNLDMQNVNVRTTADFKHVYIICPSNILKYPKYPPNVLQGSYGCNLPTAAYNMSC